MTTHINECVSFPVKATADLSGAKHKFITLAGTIAQANTGRAVAGLSDSNVGSGYHHLAIMAGIQKAYAGAAVTSAGWPAAVANSGWLTNAASGDYVVGRFLETCSSGDLVPVAIDTLNANFTPS